MSDTQVRKLTQEDIDRGYIETGCSHKHIFIMQARVLREKKIVGEMCDESGDFLGRIVE